MEAPKLKGLHDGGIFVDWEGEGVSLLLHARTPEQARTWAKLMATAPIIVETAINLIATDSIAPPFQADAMRWKLELQKLQKEMQG
jgi:hypothetical protein